MNSSRRSNFVTFTLTLLVLAFGLIWASSAQAAPAKKAPVAPPDTRTLVTAVDAKNQQVTINFPKEKTKKTYTIDGLTKIVVQGNPAPFDKIKVGLQVYNYMERNDTTLDSIDVAQAQPAPVAPGAKKK